MQGLMRYSGSNGRLAVAVLPDPGCVRRRQRSGPALACSSSSSCGLAPSASSHRCAPPCVLVGMLLRTCPASSTPRPAILPSLIIAVITPAACKSIVVGRWVGEHKAQGRHEQGSTGRRRGAAATNRGAAVVQHGARLMQLAAFTSGRALLRLAPQLQAPPQPCASLLHLPQAAGGGQRRRRRRGGGSCTQPAPHLAC